jgi:hypothetical protein
MLNLRIRSFRFFDRTLHAGGADYQHGNDDIVPPGCGCKQ